MSGSDSLTGTGIEAPEQYVKGLAELAVGIGANVQPGQVVGINVESGQEEIARAVAEAAYARGAKFVDPWLFDPFIKHSRLKHADPETLGYVPPWIGQRTLELGELGAARISFQGPGHPDLMDDIAPELLGLDMLPRHRESIEVTFAQQTNWTIVPFPVPGWARLVHPGLPLPEAYARLWDQIAHICRLDEPDPAAAWGKRLEALEATAARLTELRLDAVRFFGPGTDLTVGLLPSGRWIAGGMENAHGIRHTANIPTEEVFSAPDPQRVDGYVRSTKPLLVPGTAPIEGLTVRFEGGRAVAIDAAKGAEILRGMCARDDGASRLGEIALVDRESRIAQSGSVFYSILLDENAASHIAVGNAYPFCVTDEADKARLNRSEIHIDFMIGSDEVAVDGFLGDGSVVPLLRDGVWQI